MTAGRDQGTFICQYGTNAERLALDTAQIKPLTAWYETDTANEYKWFGSSVLYPGATRGGGVSPAQIKKIASPGNNIWIGGDSNAANFRTQSSSATGRTSDKYQKSAITWMLRYSGQCATVVGSSATGSTCVCNVGPAPNMYQQMQSFAASNADSITVISSLNDFEQSTPQTPIQVRDAFRDHFKTTINLGRTMLILLENPMASAWGGYSVLRQNSLLQINQMLRAEIKKANKSAGYQAIRIADAFSKQVDPTSATANIISGDGTDHTDNVSSRRAGPIAAAGLQDMMPFSVPRLPVSNADNASYGGAGLNVHLNTNALLVNATTSAGRTVATGYSLSNTGAASITDAYLIPTEWGNWQVIECATSGGTGANDSVRFSMNQGSTIYNAINDGDTVQGLALVMVQDMSNVVNVRLLCSIANNSLPYTNSSADGQYDNASDKPFIDVDGLPAMVMMTDEIDYSSAVMGTLNNANLEVALFFGATTPATARLYIAQPSFEKVYK